MRKVNICAIVKDEGPYLEEWLEYHLLMGISHFYIYDHGSMDNTREILNNYASLGLVTITDWSHIPSPAQRKAYTDCLEKLKVSQFSADWCAFVDVDEFIVTKGESIPEVLLQIIRINTGIIVANWVFFGSSGHREKPEGFVINNYNHSQIPFNPHVKCFILPYRTLCTGNDAHTFLPMQNVEVTTSLGERGTVGTPFHEVPLGYTPPLWINHYHTKSEKEYRARCLKGRVDMASQKPFEENFSPHDTNEVFNDNMKKFVPSIERAIQWRPWNNLKWETTTDPESIESIKESGKLWGKY